jgi:hypothetical protein
MAHWNDFSWDWDAYVATPKAYPGTHPNVQMTGVCAVTAKDVSAVGAVWYGRPQTPHGTSDFVWRTLIVHYDGTRVGNDQAFFDIVFSPNASDDYDYLNGVDGHHGADPWAVGVTEIMTPSVHPPRGLAMRRRGSDWELVPTPELAHGYYFEDVAVVDDNDVWAVGAVWPGVNREPLVMHWDGTDWSEISTPASGRHGTLHAVHAVSANDVWAGGEYHLVLHWDGSSWQETPVPQVAGQEVFLLDVAGEKPDDVWAVGDKYHQWPIFQNNTPFAMNWDGSQWTEVPCPNAPPPSAAIIAATSGSLGPSSLNGVAAVFGSVVAVGGAPGPMNTYGADVFAVVGT